MPRIFTRIPLIACIAVLFLAGTGWSQDSICFMQTMVQKIDTFKIEDSINCMEQKAGKRVYVDGETELFGPTFGLCPFQWEGIRGKVNLIICLDISGSMTGPGGTDPELKCLDVTRAFVDSMAERSPDSKMAFVSFGYSKLWPRHQTGADSMFIRIGDNANRQEFKDYLGNIQFGKPTSYAEALDTAITIFKTLAVYDTQNAVIFLSDGEPEGTDFYLKDNVVAYEDFVTSGRINNLPPTYTVFFSTPTTWTQKAEDTLKHLAEVTGGDYSSVKSPDSLAKVLIDSILPKVVPTVEVKDIYVENLQTGQTSWGHVDVSQTNDTLVPAVTLLSPIYLDYGDNQLKFSYVRVKGDSSATEEQDYKIITFNRIPDTLNLLQKTDFDVHFEKDCSHYSNTGFVGATGSTTIVTSYAPGDTVAYIRIYRGPLDNTIEQFDSVKIVSNHTTDVEMVFVKETNATSDTLEGQIVLSLNSNASKGNGTLEVGANDILIATYQNKVFIVNGIPRDTSSARVTVNYRGNIERIELWNRDGDLSGAAQYPDTVSVTTDDLLNLWAKAFDSYGRLYDASGKDTAQCVWKVEGDFPPVPNSLGFAGTGPYNSFNVKAPGTGRVIVSHPQGGIDTLTIIVGPGKPVKFTIETAADGLGASPPNGVHELIGGVTKDTLYGIGRDQHGNFSANAYALWSTSSGNTEFSIVAGPTANMGIITRSSSHSTHSDSVWAQATGGTALGTTEITLQALRDSVRVTLAAYHFIDLEITPDTLEAFDGVLSKTYPGGTITTAKADVVRLKTFGKRSNNTGWQVAQSQWSLNNLTQKRGYDPVKTDAYFEFSAKTAGTGFIVATRLVPGQPTITDSVQMTVANQLPVKYTITADTNEVTAGDTIILTITAENDVGPYPGILDKDLYWTTNQLPPEDRTPKAIQRIVNAAGEWDSIGIANELATLGDPGVVKVQFVDGKVQVRFVPTWATELESPAILTMYDNPPASNPVTALSPEIHINAGPLAALGILKEEVIDSLIVYSHTSYDTLLNFGDPNKLNLAVRGYDEYGNSRDNVEAKWSIDPTLPQNMWDNPASAQIYVTLGAPGEQQGYIYVDDMDTLGFRDSVHIYVIDNLAAQMDSVITRDTNGNGLLDKLEMYMTEEAAVRYTPVPGDTTFGGIAGAFEIKHERGTNWTPAAIYPVNARVTKFDLILKENKSPNLETGAIPEVGFKTWVLSEGWQRDHLADTVLDGAGPVISTALIIDHGDSVIDNDELHVRWSEGRVVSDVSSDLNGEIAFDIWKGNPPDTLQTNFLALTTATLGANFAKVIMKGSGKKLNNALWISIDSARIGSPLTVLGANGIRDGNMNYVPMPNRKVRLEFEIIDSIVADLYPNPIPVEELRRRGEDAVTIRVTTNGAHEMKILVFDMAGNLVRKIHPPISSEYSDDGTRNQTVDYHWDGKNGHGRYVNRGGYILKLLAKSVKTGEKTVIHRKLVVQ